MRIPLAVRMLPISETPLGKEPWNDDEHACPLLPIIGRINNGLYKLHALPSLPEMTGIMRCSPDFIMMAVSLYRIQCSQRERSP